jgi:sugar-phosphatase
MTSEIRVNCKAVLFDVDGVLVDSTRAVARVWRQWAAERGFDPDHVAHIAQGRPSLTTVRELLPDADHEVENRMIERREIEDLDGVVACAGAQELMRSLPVDRRLLVTSSTRPLAEVRLRACGFDVPKSLITGSDIQNGKPHPELFLKGAALLGFPPAECLVVEDTSAGIRAGKAAGCRVVAVRTTMPEQSLQAAGPDWIADSCSAVRFEGMTKSGMLVLLLDGVKVVACTSARS